MRHASPRRLAAWFGILLVAALPPASAFDEADAPTLRPDVVQAWHEPASLQAGDQWQGFLRLAPETNVTAVGYQACIVSTQVCIISPRPATLVDENTWMFDTTDFTTLDGGNYDWPAGRLGVIWMLNEGPNGADGFDAATSLLLPPDSEDPPWCAEDFEACVERHYIAFDVAPAPEDEDASLPLLVPAALLGAMMISRMLTAQPFCHRRK